MIDGGDGSSGNVVVNNTILQPSDGRWALNISDGSINNIVFNNIFYSTHAFRGSISIDGLSVQGFHSNYNVVTNRMSNDGGSTVMPLASWQSATQNDSNSVIAAPPALFINAAGNDYHLLSTSPARDLGRATYFGAAAPPSDIEWIVRPQGIYHDAGCYEFQTPASIADNILPVSWQNKILPDEKIVAYDLSGRLLYRGIMRELPAKILLPSTYLVFTTDRQKTLKTFFVR
jgi:hypothetical protein